jgi:hypothetical protein
MPPSFAPLLRKPWTRHGGTSPRSPPGS